MTRPLLKTLAALALLCVPAAALANGAAWGDHPATGQPGPLKETRLELEREHVTFKDGRASASFWIKNPTAEAITVKIGFPVRFPTTEGGAAIERGQTSSMDAAGVKAFAEKHMKPTLTAHGKPAAVAIEAQAQHKTYPVTYTWTMTFPPGKTSPFVVSYPMVYSWFDSDFGDRALTYEYITHTGGFWAKPIGQATFEFCDDRLIKAMTAMRPGTYYLGDRGQRHVSIKHTIHPADGKLDSKRGCVVWTRKQWTPRAGVDDLSISTSVSAGMPGPLDDMEHWETPHQLQTDRWCRPVGAAKPMFARVDLNTTALDDAKLGALWRDAVTLAFEQRPDAAGQAEAQRRLKALPEHARLDLELRFLRVLRNVPGAQAGHKFKDEALASCFAKIKPARKTDIGAANVKRLQAREASLTGKLKAALKRAPMTTDKAIVPIYPKLP